MSNRRQSGRKSLPTNRRFPAEIERRIQRGVIDYSGASAFYAKHADTARDRVRPFMIDRGHRCVELHSDLYRHYRRTLNQLMSQRSENPPDHPSDWVAWALWNAAWNYKTKNPLADDVRRREVWPTERPISDAWLPLADIPTLRPIETSGVLEWCSGELQRFPTTMFQHPRIGVRERFSSDQTALPKLTLEFEGALIALVQRAKYELRDREERERVRAEARELMEALFSEILKWLHLVRSNAHRPADLETCHQAARLHDLHGLSWSQVAQRLCRTKHTHNQNCTMRVRQAAARWYKENSPRRVPIVNN